MSGNINANLEAVLKQLYPTGMPMTSVYKDFPFLSMLKKNTKFGGDVLKVPVRVSAGSNASRDATTAFGNSGVSNNKAFLVTRGHDYTQAYIPREDWKAAVVSGNKGAFLDVAKNEIDTQINEMSRRLSRDIYRSGSGKIGQVSSVSTDTVTLTNATDARYFEKGQVLVASTADGTGSLESGSVTVSSVDRGAGTVTATANWSAGIATIAADMYLFVKGDYANPSTGTVSIRGLEAWTPTTAPTSGDNHFSVDRSADSARLAGVRYTISGSGSLRSGLMDATTELDIQTGGRPDVAFMHPTHWINLAKELESDRIAPCTEQLGQFGFEALKLRTPNGIVKVFSDADCPTSRIHLLDSSVWELASLMSAPHIFNDDNTYIRASLADAYEVRIGHYAQLVCRNPGANAIVTIS